MYIPISGINNVYALQRILPFALYCVITYVDQFFVLVQAKCSIPGAGLALATGDQGDLSFALSTGVEANLDPPGGGADDVGESMECAVDEEIEGIPDRLFVTVPANLLPPLAPSVLIGVWRLKSSAPPPPPSSSSLVNVPSR